MAALFLLRVTTAGAGPLSLEPVLTMTGDYDSNPDLRISALRAEQHGAVLLDAPLRYDGDAFHAALLSSGRYSDARGYSSLASDYLRINLTARTESERGSWEVSGGASRDSSLYHGGEADGGVGVRRDTRLAGLDWQRSVTPRLQWQMDASWTRVQYGSGVEYTALVDYRYWSVAPAIAYAISERDTASITASTGRYHSLNGISASHDRNLSLSWRRQLSETWTLNAGAGLSRSDNSFAFFLGPFYLGTFRDQQKGTIYDMDLQHKSETLSLSLHASRSLKPSGFAFLSRQEVAELRAGYQPTERWYFGISAGWQRTTDPLTGGGETRRRYFKGELSANWMRTPQWTVSLRATRVGLRYDVNDRSAASNGVNLQLIHSFRRFDLGVL